MNSSINNSIASSFSIPQGTPAAARTVLKLLQRLTHGSLAVQLPDGSMQFFGTQGAQPHAALRLNKIGGIQCFENHIYIFFSLRRSH